MSQADVQLGLLTVKRALENNPNIGFVSNLGGTSLLFVEGNNTEAIKNLEASLSISPRDPVAFATYNNLGLAYLEAGEAQKAEQYCQKSVESFPSWDTSLQSLITVLINNEKIEEAGEALKRLLSVDKTASVTKFQKKLSN